MGRKLELADICMYLPYGLKVLYYGASEDDDTQWEVRGLHHNYGVETLTGNGSVWCLPIDKCKPILRPMSELTKPMTHPDVNGGEEFVPLKYLLLQSDSCVRWEVKESIYQIVEYRIKQGLIGASYQHPKHETIKGTVFLYLTFSKLQILSRLHFDYNDLIGQGLAIDINTLK